MKNIKATLGITVNLFTIYAVLTCLVSGTTQLTFTNDSSTNTTTTASSNKNVSIAPLIVKLQSSIDAIKPEDLNEIDSPEIKKTKLQNITLIANNLDALLPQLPKPDQQKWHKTIHQLIDPAQQNIKTLMMDVMKDEWNHRGKEVAQLAIGIARAAMTSAGISFAVQAAKIGTGNVAAFDTNGLLAMGLDAAAAFALSHYQKHLGIAPATASNIITQAIITPSVNIGSFTLAVPAFKPSLNYWMLSEGITVASRFMQENNNALEQIVKTINVKDILFGKKLATDKAISTNISPFIHDVVSSENIKQALLNVGGTVFQAATIGGLLYLAGFGYAESSIVESMGYAMLTAVAQGTVAQIANIRHTTTPGALINIISAPVGQQLFAIAGGGPQAATSAIIQTVTTEISNILINEAEPGTGLTTLIQQAKTGVQSQYNSLWSSFAAGWQGLKEVFTPLTTHMSSHEDY